jgi:serine/threonine-protein kinase
MRMALDPSNPQSIESEANGAVSPVAEAASAAPVATKPGRHHFLHRLAWGAAGLGLGAILAIVAVWLWMRPAPPPPIMRFAMDLPRAAPLALGASPFAFSAAGTHLAYVAQVGDDTQLYVRTMDRLEPQPVPGTTGAYCPFFSPDDSWIGYFDSRDSKLKKVALAGGEPVALGKAEFGLGGCWGADGYIIFTPNGFSGLWRIPAAGGKPEPVTRLEKREFTHRWPEILPGNRAVIFTIGAAGTTSAMRVAAYSFKSGQRKVLLDRASDAHYSPTGHLLFLRGGDLMAVRFDPIRLEILGTPFSVKSGIEKDNAASAGQFVCSSAGALAYTLASPEEDLRTLAWVDRQGGTEKVSVSRGAFSYPRLSPNGLQLAVVIYSLEERSNIWIVDVATGAFTRLTTDGNCLMPVWTPDGNQVTFASDRDGQWNIYSVPADGSRPPDLLHKSDNPQLPNSWSTDGKFLALTEFAPDTGPDISILAMADRTLQPFIHTQYSEWGGSFSPDGRWIVYTSNESGPNQVYVQAFPGPGERLQISTAEGREPLWGRDGRELFFRYWKGLMSVAIQTEPEFNPDQPNLVISGEYEAGQIPVFRNYDVSSNGQRFLLIPREQREKRQILIDVNWFEELHLRSAEADGGKSQDRRR